MQPPCSCIWCHLYGHHAIVAVTALARDSLPPWPSTEVSQPQIWEASSDPRHTTSHLKRTAWIGGDEVDAGVSGAKTTYGWWRWGQSTEVMVVLIGGEGDGEGERGGQSRWWQLWCLSQQCSSMVIAAVKKLKKCVRTLRVKANGHPKCFCWRGFI